MCIAHKKLILFAYIRKIWREIGKRIMFYYVLPPSRIKKCYWLIETPGTSTKTTFSSWWFFFSLSLSLVSRITSRQSVLHVSHTICFPNSTLVNVPFICNIFDANYSLWEMMVAGCTFPSPALPPLTLLGICSEFHHMQSIEIWVILLQYSMQQHQHLVFGVQLYTTATPNNQTR